MLWWTSRGSTVHAGDWRQTIRREIAPGIDFEATTGCGSEADDGSEDEDSDHGTSPGGPHESQKPPEECPDAQDVSEAFKASSLIASLNNTIGKTNPQDSTVQYSSTAHYSTVYLVRRRRGGI